MKEKAQKNKMAEVKGDKSVHLDDVLHKFGGFGRYQIRMILMLGFAFFLNGCHSLNFIFITEDAPFRCVIDQCELNDTSQKPSWYNFTAPTDYYNRCYKYAASDSGCTPINFNSTALEPCIDWVYEDKNTFVAEYDLACEDYKRTLVGTIHSIGLMLGLFFQGQLSDKFGRKAAIIIAGLAAAILGISKSFASTYLLYIILEFLESTFGDNCSPAFIMSVELVHGDHRLDQQFFLCLIYAIGGIFFAVSAYLVPYWRHFITVIYMPSLIFMFYYFWMDESVRWLLSKGKKEKAIEILLKIAKTNKVNIDEKQLVNLKYEEKTEQSSPLRETFRSKIVVRRFLVSLVWWISCTFIAYGLLVNMVSLAGDKYVNYVLLTLADIPACIAMVYTLKRFKRKKPLFLSFILAGILCMVQAFIPKSIMWLSTGLYLCGKFLITFTFATVYMYTSELFPTYTRNSMLSLCSAIGRIGSVLAPMTPLLLQYSDKFPTLLISGISFFAGLVTLFVPDLDDVTLPDNVKQAESVGAANVAIVITEKVNGYAK